jgi:hypothetical protein
MAVGYNPKIVTNGLVLCLDAGNTRSYPGSGTTWTDMISGLTGTLTNGPTYSSSNGGSIVFDGLNDQVTIPANSIFNFGTGDFTIEAWIYWDGTYSSLGRIIYATGGSGSLDQFGIFSDSSPAYLYFGGIGTGTSTPPANSWSQVVASRIGTTLTLYINASQSATGTQASSIGSSVGTAYVGIRADGNHPFKSNISCLRIYKGKGLTAAEIRQNFNATRGRYGI